MPPTRFFSRFRSRKSFSLSDARSIRSGLSKNELNLFMNEYFADNPNDAKSLEMFVESAITPLKLQKYALFGNLGTMVIQHARRENMAKKSPKKRKDSRETYNKKRYYRAVVNEFFNYMDNIALASRGMFTGRMRKNVRVSYYQKGVKITFPIVAKFLEFGTPIEGDRYQPPAENLIKWVEAKWAPQPAKLYEGKSEWKISKREASKLESASQKAAVKAAAFRLSLYILRNGTQPYPFIRESLQYMNEQAPSIASRFKNPPKNFKLEIFFRGEREDSYDRIIQGITRPDIREAYYTTPHRIEGRAGFGQPGEVLLNRFKNYSPANIEVIRQKYPKFRESFDGNIIDIVGKEIGFKELSKNTKLSKLALKYVRNRMKSTEKEVVEKEQRAEIKRIEKAEKARQTEIRKEKIKKERESKKVKESQRLKEHNEYMEKLEAEQRDAMDEMGDNIDDVDDGGWFGDDNDEGDYDVSGYTDEDD